MDREAHYLIPDNKKGIQVDLVHEEVYACIEDAEDLFVDAMKRLLIVNKWHQYAANVKVKLTDNHDKEVTRRAHSKDHVQFIIDNNAPVTFSIDAIEYDDYPDDNKESIAIRVSPIQDSGTAAIDPDFATNTLVIERDHAKLVASYHGRNNDEKKDTDEWQGLNENKIQEFITNIISFKDL